MHLFDLWNISFLPRNSGMGFAGGYASNDFEDLGAFPCRLPDE